MFTGIITNTTKVLNQNKHPGGVELVFEKPKEWTDLELGESIATNGVCLTVSEFDDATYKTVLMPETLERSSFGVVVPEFVNLERSMKADTRLGGHFVQGHVDGIGEITNIAKAQSWIVSVKFDPKDQNLVVYKGSISIDGVSLTVATVEENILTVSLVDHTIKNTVFQFSKTGDPVNLEFDIFGKYIEKHMAARS